MPKIKLDNDVAKRLSVEELATIWNALENRKTTASRALRVHMLTGQRSSEVREMRIGDVVGCWWHLPMTKGGRRHRVFLAPPVRAILDEVIDGRLEGPVFCAPGSTRPIVKQGYNLLASRITEVPDWRPHDFRHRFASWLYSHENLEEHIIWALLNHKVGLTSSQGYARPQVALEEENLVRHLAQFKDRLR